MIGNKTLLNWLEGKTSAEKHYLLNEIADQLKEMNHADQEILDLLVKLNLQTSVRIEHFPNIELYIKISATEDSDGESVINSSKAKSTKHDEERLSLSSTPSISNPSSPSEQNNSGLTDSGLEITNQDQVKQLHGLLETKTNENNNVDNIVSDKEYLANTYGNRAHDNAKVKPSETEEEESIKNQDSKKHVKFKHVKRQNSGTENVANVESTSTINSQRQDAKRAGEFIEEHVTKRVKQISQHSENINSQDVLALDYDNSPVLVRQSPSLNENCKTPVQKENSSVNKTQFDCTSSEATSTDQTILPEMPLVNSYLDTQLEGLVVDSQVVCDSTVSSSNSIEPVESVEDHNITEIVPDIKCSTSNINKTEILVPEVKFPTGNISTTEILVPEIKCSNSNLSKTDILVPEIKFSMDNKVTIDNALNLYLKYFGHVSIPEDVQFSIPPFVDKLNDNKQDQDCVRAFYYIYLMYFNDNVYKKVNKAAEILHLSISDLQRKMERLDRSLKLSSEHLKSEEKKRANSEYCEMVALRGVGFKEAFISLMENIPYFELGVLIFFFRLTQALFNISSGNIKYIIDTWQLMATLLKSDDLKLTSFLNFFPHVKITKLYSFYYFSKRCLVSLYQSGYTDLVSNTILSLSHLPPCPIDLSQVDQSTSHHNPAMVKPEFHAGIKEEEERDLKGNTVPLCDTPHYQLKQALEQVSVQQRAKYDEISAKSKTNTNQCGTAPQCRSPPPMQTNKAENSTLPFNTNNVNVGVQRNNKAVNHQNQTHVQHIPTHYVGKQSNDTSFVKEQKNAYSPIQAPFVQPLQKIPNSAKKQTETRSELLRKLCSLKNDMLLRKMPTYETPNTRLIGPTELSSLNNYMPVNNMPTYEAPNTRPIGPTQLSSLNNHMPMNKRPTYKAPNTRPIGPTQLPSLNNYMPMSKIPTYEPPSTRPIGPTQLPSVNNYTPMSIMPTYEAPNTRPIGSTQHISKVAGSRDHKNATTTSSAVDPRLKTAGQSTFNVDPRQNIAERNAVNIDPQLHTAGCSTNSVDVQCEAAGCISLADVKCSICYSAFYCSAQCQKHWYDSHYQECSGLRSRFYQKK